MKQHTEDYKETAVKYYLENKEDIYKVISNILEKKITQEQLKNYLKHSYKIYKS